MNKTFVPLAAFLLAAAPAFAQSPSWHEVPSGTTKNLLSVSFGSPQYGFISGQDSTLLRTTNGGLSWSPVPHTGMSFNATSPDIIDINFVTPAVGFAIVSHAEVPEFKGSMYKTTDSGASWTAVMSGNIAAARSFFFNENNGFQIGSAFFAGHTVIKLSGGVWGAEQYLSPGSSEFLYGIDFRDNNTGIIGGSGGYVYRSFDGGASWDTIKTSTDSTIYALQYMSDSVILAATSDLMSGLMISTDAGASWAPDGNTLTFFYPQMRGLARSLRDSFIAVGSTATSLTAPDGFVLTYENGTPGFHTFPHPFQHVAMRDDSIAYAVGDSGIIVTNRLSTTSIAPNIMQDRGFSLYPNPAKGIVRTSAGFAHCVKVYDLAGRLVLSAPTMRTQQELHLEDAAKGLYLIALIPVNAPPVYETLVLE